MTDHLSATAAAYDAVAELYAEMARDEPRLPLDRALLAAFAEHTRSGPVAELGCGPGQTTAHLRKLGLDAFGVDLSPAMVALARTAYPGVRFDVGSMSDVDAADGSLGGVACWYSVIHTPPRELLAYFAEFYRVLCPGGPLLLGFFEADDDEVSLFDHKAAPAYRWPVDAMSALAHTAGFTELARLTRTPLEGERHPRGHLLMQKPL